MTRVSDRAEFAAAVAHARRPAVPRARAAARSRGRRAAAAQTRELAGERPWGVGILGFVPPELRAEQLEVVRRAPTAVRADRGRPPRPGAGARGAGHRDLSARPLAGPAEAVPRRRAPGDSCSRVANAAATSGRARAWCCGTVDARVLLEAELPRVRSATSCSPAASTTRARPRWWRAAAAGASERGVKVGVLLGTAYLFTSEATETGAITPTFQQAAIAAESTELLESGPGHATRCLPSPFVDQFAAAKRAASSRRPATARSCASGWRSSTSAACASRPRAPTATPPTRTTRPRPRAGRGRRGRPMGCRACT